MKTSAYSAVRKELTWVSEYMLVNSLLSDEDTPLAVAIELTSLTGITILLELVLDDIVDFILLGKLLDWMFPINDVVNTAINTDPISAVPKEDPKFWKTPCRPPASDDCSLPTLDIFTFPICEARRPKADPAKNNAVPKSQPFKVVDTEASRHIELTIKIS